MVVPHLGVALILVEESSDEQHTLDGRMLARKCNVALKQRISGMARPPGLAVILVGEDPASQVYVNKKGRVAGRLGLHHQQITMPATASMDEVLEQVDRLNADDEVDGILVQLPLPKGLDESRVMDRITPAKDVDGFHSQTLAYSLKVARRSFRVHLLGSCVSSKKVVAISRGSTRV